VSISLSGKESRLTTMLPYRQWLSWSPDRRHVVVVEGDGREALTGKHLAVCDAVSGECQSIAGEPGTVALDPAWSPDGTRIAYVEADDAPGTGFGNWLSTRQLWTMKPDGSDAKRLGALDGVDAPRWLPDSTRMFSIGGENALWLVDPTFVGPVASRLYEGEFPPGYYYGFVDWSESVAWRGP
jgi:Tol biopolymer transport system component